MSLNPAMPLPGLHPIHGSEIKKQVVQPTMKHGFERPAGNQADED
jgi:hypothetical protein